MKGPDNKQMKLRIEEEGRECRGSLDVDFLLEKDSCRRITWAQGQEEEKLYVRTCKSSITCDTAVPKGASA